MFTGYNGQSSNIVYGIEGDIGYNARKGTTGRHQVERGIDGSLRARLGYAAVRRSSM